MFEPVQSLLNSCFEAISVFYDTVDQLGHCAGTLGWRDPIPPRYFDLYNYAFVAGVYTAKWTYIYIPVAGRLFVYSKCPNVSFIYVFSLQRDSGLARMLFASLFQAVFAQVDHVLTDREAESTKKAVRDGLNAVLEASTHFYPPFIGSVQVGYIEHEHPRLSKVYE